MMAQFKLSHEAIHRQASGVGACMVALQLYTTSTNLSISQRILRVAPFVPRAERDGA